MKRTFIIALFALMVGLLLGAVLFHRAPAPAPVAEQAPVVWTCSMHPQIQQPNPGKCPICAMALIPLGSGPKAAGDRSYAMSPAAAELARITTAPITRGNPEVTVRLFGKVGYDETRLRTIAARFPGRIDRLFVDYTGIRVSEGDHLAEIYSPELLAAQSELLTALRFNNAGGVDIARDKLRLWGFSPERIAAVEESGQTSDRLTIDSTAGGVVVHRGVDEGAYVQTGTPLFKIAALDQLWVMLDAYESDLAWIRYGQSVTFRAEALPGREFEGQVSFIAPELDSASRTVPVRVSIANPEGVIRPGMFVRAEITAMAAEGGLVVDPALAGKWVSPMHPEVVKDGPGKCDVCGMDLVPAESLGYAAGEALDPPLMLPASAVLHTGPRSVVYVEIPDAEEPTYEGKEVVLGPRAGNFYLVQSGLEEGERVVVEGAFKIDSALQILARESMMNPGGPPPPTPDRITMPPSFVEAHTVVFDAYLAVQKALAGDALEPAMSSAQGVAGALGSVPMADLPEAGRIAWMPVAERLETAAEKIAAAPDIAAARTAFEDLSKAADESVRRFGLSPGRQAFEMFCPMAFGQDKGAAWLQGDEDLINPYQGSNMLHCGDVRAEIATPPPPPEKAEPDVEAEAPDPHQHHGH